MQLLVSKANKALVVPRGDAVQNLFPEAPHLDDYRCIIPHGMKEFVLLKRLGFDGIPHPMLTYYDWAGGTPFTVQKSTCAMLVSNPRSYVLNAMGTGKTKAALWAWDYLYGNKYAGKTLIVAPLSTLNFVWAAEVFATLPHRKCVVLGSAKGMSRKRRLELLNDPEADIFVINHDGFKVIADEIASKPEINHLIIDELAAFRNTSDRSKLMRKFAERMDWVWGLTGAPMPNEPTDVWMQARIITPHTVPKYRTHARDMLMTQISQHVWKPKPDATEKAFAMLQPAVRFMLDDVTELPDIIERTIDVPLSPKQKQVYDTISREFRMMVDGKEITAVNAAAAMNKLLQISGGWVYAGALGAVSLEAQPRADALADLIMACQQKVIVFLPFRHMCEALPKLIMQDPRFAGEFLAGRFEYAMVHGDTGDRDSIFNDFQNTDRYKVLFAHPRCMAHGLTLTAADTNIWYCPIVDLEIYQQANARIRRVGQKHKQQIIHLQATPVEKKIYALLRSKQRVQDKLLAMFEEATIGVS